jgi:hypothetical protein
MFVMIRQINLSKSFHASKSALFVDYVSELVMFGWQLTASLLLRAERSQRGILYQQQTSLLKADHGTLDQQGTADLYPYLACCRSDVLVLRDTPRNASGHAN